MEKIRRSIFLVYSTKQTPLQYAEAIKFTFPIYFNA